MPPITRRDILKMTSQGLLGLSGLLGLGGLIRFLSYEPDPPPPTRFEIGPAQIYPLDSRTAVPSVPAVLFHTKDGFSALSLVCTHLGCTVEVKADSFACPCHGSQYDRSGNVTQGPAVNPLPKLKVEVTPDNKIVIYRD
jgi:cytochrome b6-f complex iron-sulfur subunit